MIKLKRPEPGCVVLKCSEVDLADLRWLVGQAIKHFAGNDPYSKEHLAVAIEAYNALNVGLSPGAELYLHGTALEPTT